MNHLIRASSLSGYVPLATSLGLDAERSLQRFGLSVQALDNPESLIPYRALIELLAHAAQISGCPDFGLRLSQGQGMGILGPLAVAIEHAATLQDALSVAARYLFVHTSAARLDVRRVRGHADEIDLCYAIDLPDLPSNAQAIELALGVIQGCLRMVGQGRVPLLAVSFPHARQGPQGVYERVFGAPCLFDQAHAAVRLSASDLVQPLPRSNDMLRRLAQAYLDSQYTAPERAFADRVRLQVREGLASGQASHAHVAEQLAVHPRTMQRRLSEEGTSFERIKDEVRRQQFQQLIQQRGGPSISTMAGLLDYAEPSALTRSARRWFGKTPSQMRSSP